MSEFIEKLRVLSSECRNMYDLCIKLGIEKIGGNTYREIEKIANENGIKLIFEKKLKRGEWTQYKLEEILIKDSLYTNSTSLKRRLINEGLKENKCECCNRTEWMGKPINLQLHHKNGVHNDNRLENLQLLCPNCHSYTENYAGKNSDRENYKKRQENKKRDKIIIPIEKEELDKLIRMYSFRSIGKMFNVSDNTIRNWCKKYELVYRKCDLK